MSGAPSPPPPVQALSAERTKSSEWHAKWAVAGFFFGNDPGGERPPSSGAAVFLGERWGDAGWEIEVARSHAITYSALP